ncbi:hypothetical protein CKO42_08465 [Lamprobacter modestohalophilus]|uniref:DUF4132 domain-containing protein n=1 Tax=Lamprobacter modestohalophilus TaxID=1064514 RepID=A0A9X0W7Z4_9GAMM|nr:hypothetical protein [Lamprobacter modestohalophilus]MBK1618469.1 hypothetical protein [Lamprobacter modestohalophilus]
MPNYLYPEAARAWARRELAGLRLTEDLREALEIQLASWASQREDNAQIIQALTEGAPDWAVKRHAQGQALHHFVPSDATRQTLHQVLGLVTEAGAVVAFSEHEALVRRARKLRKSLTRRQIGVPELLEQRQRWVADPARLQALQALGELDRGDLPNTLHGQWRECETLEQVHWVGRQLDNCLADGDYDDDFEDRANSGLQLYYLHDDLEPTGQAVAAASFYFGELDDFEAEGSNRSARQEAAKQYKEDLLDLLNDRGFEVSPLNRRSDTHLGDRAELIERVGICGRIDLDEYEFAEVDGFRFWYEWASDVLIVRPLGRACVIQIDIDFEADRGFVMADDEADCDWPAGVFGLVSLRRQIDPALLDGPGFDRFCRALSRAVKSGALDLSLTCFHEFADDGFYWRDGLDSAITTRMGRLLVHEERAWWLPAPGRLAYVWYDTEADDRPIDPTLRERMLKRVAKTYERPAFFWSALADLGLAYPDLHHDVVGAPLLEPTVAQGQRVAADAGWRTRGRSEDGLYTYQSRLVDDYQDVVKPSEQWLCRHRDHGPVAGLLVRHEGPRKRWFHLQAPGQDPRGLYLLKAALASAGLINRFSEFTPDHHLVLFDQHQEDLLLTKRGHPVASKESIGTTGYRLGGSQRRLLIFDAHERLVLILRLAKDEQLRDAGLIGDPEALRTDLPGLLAALGVTPNDRLAWIADRLGYRVIAGALQPVQPAPTLDDPRVSLSVTEDQVEILFEPEDRDLLADAQCEQDALGNNLDDLQISLPPVRMTLFKTGALTLDGAIQPDADDPDYGVLQEAVRQAASYLSVSLEPEIERLFGLQRQPNGQYRRVTTTPPPIDWTFVGDGQQARWMLDDDIAAPAVWYNEGIISCAAEDCERLIAACDSVRKFLAWRDAPAAASSQDSRI